jgi:hypothetical protein
MRSRQLLVLFTLALASASVAAAQAVPVTRYTTPAAELKAEFSSIASVVQLRDGRVLIVDSKDDRLALADFRSNGVTTVGRNGEGPREYRRLARVIPTNTDTVLIHASSRYLYYTPSGGLLDKIITDRALLMMTPTGSDPSGRLYFQGPLMSFAKRRSHDSIPVYRVDRRTLRGDTVAWLRPGAATQMEAPQKSGGNMGLRLTDNPYRYLDGYGVLDDGTIIVARARDYSIEVIAPDGKRTKSGPNPFPKLPIPKAAREANPELPEFKPPMMYLTSIGDRTSPRGQFWLRRHTTNIDDAEELDIIDRTGRICGHVVMPRETTLRGFSQEWVYAARTDSDGLTYLQRYPYPTCK